MVYHQKLGRFYSDWHRHAWGQLVYAENGCIHLNVSGKKVLLPGWYGAWIPPDTFHEIWSENADLFVRAICFTVEDSNDSLQELAVFPASPLLKEMIRYSERWNQVNGEDRQERVFLQALQDVLPGEIARSVKVYLPSTNHEKLARLLEYVQNHLHEKISIETLARQFGFSVRTLTRLFNGQLGTSFSGYCKIARILKALELIETGSDNVSQIAGRVGYESLATFSNTFLAICGNRPLYFINQKRTNR